MAALICILLNFPKSASLASSGFLISTFHRYKNCKKNFVGTPKPRSPKNSISRLDYGWSSKGVLILLLILFYYYYYYYVLLLLLLLLTTNIIMVALSQNYAAGPPYRVISHANITNHDSKYVSENAHG